MRQHSSTKASSLRPRLVGSRLLASSWQIKLYEDTLRYDDNSRSTFRYARLTIPSFVTVIASRDSDGRVAMVRQYRPGARRIFWEFPAGMVESGENPLVTVKREFEEEVGYELLRPILLAKCYQNPSRSAQVAFIFSGKVGKKTRRHLDRSERLEVMLVKRAEALTLIQQRISSIYLLAYLLASNPSLLDPDRDRILDMPSS